MRQAKLGFFILIISIFSGFVHAGEYETFRDSLKSKSRKVNFGYPKFIQLGAYAGWNTNENLEFGLSIPIISYSQFIPRKQTLTPNMPENNIELSLSHFSALAAPLSERYYIPTPYPKRLAVQIGLEKAILSQVYGPSFGIQLTPFSLFGYMYGKPFHASSGFHFRYFLNHILVDANYLPSVNIYNDTWKVGGGAMWRLPFRRLSWHEHMSIRLIVNYHYRIEENNPFRHNEFTFALNITGWEYQSKRGYRISDVF